MTLIIDFKNKQIKGYYKAKDFQNGKVKQDIINLLNLYGEDING